SPPRRPRAPPSRSPPRRTIRPSTAVPTRAARRSGACASPSLPPPRARHRAARAPRTVSAGRGSLPRRIPLSRLVSPGVLLVAARARAPGEHLHHLAEPEPPRREADHDMVEHVSRLVRDAIIGLGGDRLRELGGLLADLVADPRGAAVEQVAGVALGRGALL